MIEVSTDVTDDTTDRGESSSDLAGTETIESYETDDGVVFYDAENPLAWVETSHSLMLSELA
ncbi:MULTISPECIES: DUF7331 family protein [Natronorubrum]|uniref:Uncharacterized protein n=2 Tax=Natronorubrum TaxID=134813 RepID=A0A1N6Y3S7_9EURY|nr:MULTISPECIES: hypothetical protein [Natronorubrum]SEH11351.1 hypothetical protein SAMN04487967_0309 [Natronorubrum sediminis]SIR09119.1 hypothetical protein SAMN05421809_0302 [Natronorubrum daqingense]